MNLVHDRSRHPWVEESVHCARSRVLASATVATRDDPAVAIGRLRGVDVVEAEGGRLTIRTARADSADIAVVDVSQRPPREVEIAGRTVHGHGLRVVTARDDGLAFAGERIESIDGVLTLTRPGIVSVALDRLGVEATVGAGLRLDAAWAGGALDMIRVREGSCFGPAIRLAEAGVVPDRLVRSHARRLGSRLVTLRFERGG
jgi:methyl coenzyme M reductase gamma subunit